MHVTCPACATEYIADEGNFHGNTARMRCAACDTVWLVSRVAEPEEYPIPQARPASDRSHAAVVRRGTARERRDLFATQEPDLGSVKQTLRPAPFSSGVAARNETSVLFTIDSLKQAAAVQSAPPPPVMTNPVPNGRPDDDDGLIDLKALSSIPPRIGPNAPQPLFTSEPPPGAFARELSSPGSILPLAGKRPTKLIAAIAGGIAAAALMVVGVAVAFRGEEPAKNVATASIAAAKPVAPPPVVTAPPPVVTAPSAAPAPAPAAKEDEAAKPVATGKKGKGGKGKSARPAGLQKVGSSGVATKSESAPAPKPAAKSADACGCKGNFDCIIRCSAKGK